MRNPARTAWINALNSGIIYLLSRDLRSISKLELNSYHIILIGGLMKIVLFDDNLSDLNRLSRLIECWQGAFGCRDVIVRQFNSISELDFSFADVLYFDVFFLDIMTPESQSTGFGFAERIHLKNPRALIIFTTNSREYMQNAFEISAFRYLLKPLSRDYIFSLLDKIYSSPSLRSQTTVVLPGIFQKEVLDSDRIIYIKARTSDHRADVLLTDGSALEISLSAVPFSKIAENCLPDDFIQCRRSFIINLNYVTGFDNRSVYLLNHYQVDIGRTFHDDLINRIINRHKGLEL